MKYRALGSLVDDPQKFVEQPPLEPQVFDGSATVLELLTTAEIDEVIARGGARTPGLTLAQSSKPAPTTEITLVRFSQEPDIRDLADPLGVAEYLQAGYSLTLNNLHRYHERLGRFAERLGYELANPVKAISFFTPPGAQAFTQHHDTASNFICQTEGRKLWRLYRPAVSNPLDRHPWSWTTLSEEDRNRLIDGPADMEVLLEAGSVLWIPRGWIHAGVTEDDLSLHVSFRVETSTEHWLAQTVVDWLADQRDFRQDLPAGFAASPELGRSAVKSVLEKMAAQLSEGDLPAVTEYVRTAHFSRFIGPRMRPITDVLRGTEGVLDNVQLRPEGAIGHSWENGALRVHLGSAERIFEGPSAVVVRDLLLEEPDDLVATAVARLGQADGERLVRQLVASGLAVRDSQPW
ncbi:JmjC domain-containing protein [Streptomyces nojiriensis]|uniref:JmjC domain-containing protein n=1 Tax=Streptomyces nojiriensis TaxID=66374 RepID=UPI0035DD7544